MNTTNIIQRAFEVAPECGTIDEIKRKLVHEGYFQVEAHLEGKQIRSELSKKLTKE